MDRKTSRQSLRKNGEWAASGQVNPDLLAVLLDEDSFSFHHRKARGVNYLIWLG